MDPITAAVVAAVAKLGDSAVKDAYQGLKDLIVRRFGADNRVTRAAQDLEERPDSDARTAVLTEEVAASDVLSEPEIVAAARFLLERAGGGPVQNTVTASGERSVAIGGDAKDSTIRTGDTRGRI